MGNPNKFAAVEGLLYSYKNLKHRIINIDIDIALGEDPVKLLEEREQFVATRQKVELMLNVLKNTDSRAYEVIRLKYIDGYSQVEIAKRLYLCEETVSRIKTKAIKDILIGFIN